MKGILGNIAELWGFRSLLKALVVRHLSARYRGSVLGLLWSFLNPLCLMLVYTVVFKYYVKFQVDNYTIFVFCGLLPWIWTTSALIEGTTSLVSSGHLITKSMFPSHLLPTVTVLTAMVHYLLSLPLLFVFMLGFGASFHATLVFVPFLIFLHFIFLIGIVLGLSALNVFYRDVQHIIGNLITFLFFLCPILYPASTVPERFRFTIDYNPFAVFTVIYHKLILEGVMPTAMETVFVVSVSLIAFLLGNMIFNNYREGFAELL